jgi:UDP-N-acetylglucosamine 4,6-dehydratase
MKNNQKNYFKNKALLITGGTGSFGNAAIDKLLSFNFSEIRIFSRDEKKQSDMRSKFNNSKIKFHIGDVRDFSAVRDASKGVDYIFHAAALKQVPSCEFYPLEAVKTNILGTENVLEAGIQNNVKRVVCLSTDKSVYPINSMGISKAMMEKLVIAKSRTSGSTSLCVTRYGNVLGSRGSILPLLVQQMKESKSITLTDPKMTRFMMTLDDAIDLVIFALMDGDSGSVYVKKSPAASIDILAKAISICMNKKNYPIKIIGTRHGEKLHESLMSREEVFVSKDLGDFYKIPPDNRDLNYINYVKKGNLSISNAEDYTSYNTTQLNVRELSKILLDNKKLKNIFDGSDDIDL